MLGLSGVHGTGKSTLAKLAAERLGIRYIPSEASSAFTHLGLDPAKDYPFSTRLLIQWAILIHHEKLYKQAAQSDILFIADRTPIDFMAYLLADCQRENITDEEAIVLQNFMDKAFDVMNSYFGAVIVVQPGFKIEARVGKGSVNSAYIEHLNAVIVGLSADRRLYARTWSIHPDNTDNEKRFNAVKEVLDTVYESIIAERKVFELPVH